MKRVLAGAALSLFMGETRADYALNMPRGVTPLSQDIYDLHMLIFWICCVIGVIVFGAMFWSILQHRKSTGAVAAKFHHSTKAEIVWTIIPVLILVAMAVPATRTLVRIEQAGDADITIKVTGNQWKWRYDYVNPGFGLDGGFGFFSVLKDDSNQARQVRSGIDPRTVEHYLLDVDKPLVVPVNTKIRFLTTASDVVHAWWVPALGWKRDSIPGYINESWAIIQEPGTYRGQCAELCGKDHAYMPIVVKAVTQDEYFDFIGEQMVAAASESAGADREWNKDELMEKGGQVYNTFCVACHQANGQGLPPAFPPLAGGAISTGPVDGHIERVMNGKAGTTMAAFGPQLGDVDLAAVITYERNSFGNSTGDIVQPAAIRAVRK
ncbi:MAG: cytochrome c oxidase subunit II [Gammaproteobacteria bacterium]|nr:cytochrome c oxidase subunit II [Gammaproteobacteria bacterium]